jgi:hypothetical protein
LIARTELIKQLPYWFRSLSAMLLRPSVSFVDVCSSPGPVHYTNTRQTKGGKPQDIEGTKIRVKKSLENKVNKTSDEDREEVRLENEIDFCPVVLTMVMIAGLRDCCWTSLLRSSSRPLCPHVTLLSYWVQRGPSPIFNIASFPQRSASALVRLSFIAVSSRQRLGERTTWWVQTTCNGGTGAVASSPYLG